MKIGGRDRELKLIELVRMLPEVTLFRALEEALTEEQKKRLAESWFDIDVEAS